jgi:hypothetical protein
MLSSHKIDYKLPDRETDDTGEKMNIEVLNAQMVTLAAQMVTLRVETDEKFRAQGEQLRALQGTVLFDFIRNVISAILLVFAGKQPHKTESYRFRNADGPFLSRIIEYV